jgi:hypothetical protein
MKKRTLTETIMLCIFFTSLGLPSAVAAPAGVSPAGAGTLPAAVAKYDLAEFARRLRPFVLGHESAPPEDLCCESLFFACELIGLGSSIAGEIETVLEQNQEMKSAFLDLVEAGRQDGFCPRLTGTILAVHCSNQIKNENREKKR